MLGNVYPSNDGNRMDMQAMVEREMDTEEALNQKWAVI